MADLLLHLQRAGHPQYVEWTKSFACKTVTQSELQDINQQMKTDLRIWLLKVSTLRTKLYALNYFSSLQLLRISKEFYCLINNPSHEISNQVLLLLMSLSCELTVAEIKKVTSTSDAQSIALRNKISITSPDCDDSFYIMDEIDIPQELKKFNEAEKKIYHLCIQDYGFDEQMVIAAIRLHGSNEDKVLKWCFNPVNAQNFESDPIVNEDTQKVEVDISNATDNVSLDVGASNKTETKNISHTK